MSVPRKHHYLPEFYQRRWAVDGLIWRFERPRGLPHPVFAKQVPPSSAGHLPDLYTNPVEVVAERRQAVEMQVFQQIDEDGARAIESIEDKRSLPLSAKLDLARFVMSLLHRSPSRVDFIQAKLRKHFEADWSSMPNFDEVTRGSALRLMTKLLDAGRMISRMGSLHAYGITLDHSRYELLLSDRPVLLSNGIGKPEGFVIFPAAPRRLIILANREDTPRAFASYEHSVLTRAINDAIVTQAQHTIIATDTMQRQFIENRFLRGHRSLAAATNPFDGLVRWDTPRSLR